MKEREREGCERGETKRDGGQFQGVTEKKNSYRFQPRAVGWKIETRD